LTLSVFIIPPPHVVCTARDAPTSLLKFEIPLLFFLKIGEAFHVEQASNLSILLLLLFLFLSFFHNLDSLGVYPYVAVLFRVVGVSCDSFRAPFGLLDVAVHVHCGYFEDYEGGLILLPSGP